MRFRILIPATLALLLVGCSAGGPMAMFAPQAGSQKCFLAKIDKLMPGMGAKKIVDRKDSQMAFERICFDNSAPGKDVERAALCKAIMQRVGPRVAMPARVWLLRKVESIGREEVVPRLTELLRDKCPEIRELARRALENNPTAAAGAVLRDELKIAKCPVWRVVIINALAFRRDGDAVDAIAADVGNADSAVAKAAIAALGEIATEPAMKALTVELAKAKPQTGDLVVDACLRGAERMAAAGDSRGAAEIYDAVQKASTAENIQMAALQGICATKGADAVPMLIGLINGKDSRMQLFAGDCVQRIQDVKTTKAVVSALAKAAPQAQAVLLDVLGKRGDKTASPTVMKYVDADEPDVRIAAIGALRYLGNGTMVEMLAKRAAGTTGEEHDAARDSLKGMRGADVDAAIMQLIPTAQDRMKAELVRAAAVRLMKPAYDYMLTYADDSDETVRVSAITSVGKLAPLKDMPNVLKALATVSGEMTLTAAKEALVQICSQTSDAEERTRPLIQAMASAEPAAQAVAIRALAALKGQNALVAIRSAIKSEHDSVKKTATDALADWGPFYCTAWVFAGPFRKEGAKIADLFDMAFPPEDAQAKVEWKKLKKVKGKDINLDQIDEKGVNCCAYISATIASDKAQDVVLGFGSDDGVKVWLNGKIVNAKNVSRSFKLDDDQVSASLKKGDNTLLIKVTQRDNEWRAACGIKAPEGGPPPGVTCGDSK